MRKFAISLGACLIIAAAPLTLPIGKFIDWEAPPNNQIAHYKSGAIAIAIQQEREGGEDGLVLAKVTVSGVGPRPIVMRGEQTRGGYGNSIGIGPLNKGGKPAILFQSFSGGAHCCTVLRGVVPTGGGYRQLELASSDGEGWDFPRDVSGDGVADFIGYDNRFLYAFSSYAGSIAPPLIHNLVGTQMVDVSRRNPFKPYFVRAMPDARKYCLSGEPDRNGACAGYVALAARAGQFEKAWTEMLQYYDKTATEWPDGCGVVRAGECPSHMVIKYRSFPAALRGFLTANGYLPAAK